MRVQYCAMQPFGMGHFDHIQRIVTADEPESAEQRRCHVVGMSGATGHLFAQQGKGKQIFKRKRVVEQQVRPVHRADRTGRTGAESAAQGHLFVHLDVEATGFAGMLQKGFDRYAGGVFIGTKRQPAVIARNSGDTDPGFSLPGQFNDIARLVKRETERVEAAGHVGHGCRCENGDCTFLQLSSDW